MASLFYLLTLYCVVRGAMSSRAVFWYAAAALACLLGAATKELLVTAPLLVLLYDRTLLTGTFAQSLRRRWGLYLALAATWLLLVWLVLSAGLLPRRSEYLAPNPWSYALTQPQVICHYLRLSLWPHPLCFWYKWPLARTWGAILPGASVVAALLAATLWGLLRRQPWALLGAWFFLILAPTSSILPLSDLACEHWMYLPLAAVLAALVLGAHRAGQSLLRRRVVSRPVLKVVSGCLTLVACTVLGILTVKRNADYRTEVSLWRSAAASAPWNDGAHNNLGALLADQGKLAEGIAHLQRSVEINPTVAVPRCNLANALAKQGRLGDAIAQYRKAVELQPNFVDAHNNLGFTLLRQGQPEEALAHLRKALEIDPACANAHNNLGLVLRQQGNLVEAIAHYRKAVAIRPDNAELHCNLGNALRQQGLDAEAAAQYQKAVEIRPDFVEAHLSLGLALQGLGRVDEAIAHFQKAVEIRPADIEARQQLGNVLYGWKRDRQAVAQWREVLRARPDAIDTLNTMAWALATSPDASLRNGQEAVALAHRAAQFCDARDPAILDTLAAAYAESGRFPEAIHMAQQAQSLAESQHNRPLVGNIAGRIKLYRTGAPFRDRR
jgi:tetratricopeptide (TPR) repeat protein